MQVKRCHFPGFTAKNAGGPVVFNEQKQKQKKNHRDYRDLNIVLGWPCECHLNRLFK